MKRISLPCGERSGIKCGAFDFIMKPLNLDYLAHSLGKAKMYCEMHALEKNYKLSLEAEVKKKTAELLSPGLQGYAQYFREGL